MSVGGLSFLIEQLVLKIHKVDNWVCYILLFYFNILIYTFNFNLKLVLCKKNITIGFHIFVPFRPIIRVCSGRLAIKKSDKDKNHLARTIIIIGSHSLVQFHVS